MQDPQSLSDDHQQPHTGARKRPFPVFALLACVMGALILAAAGWAYCQIHGTEGRMVTSSPFPWEGQGLSVRSVSAIWKASKGDARMEMRATHYPVARIKLGEGEGNGLMQVTFHDEFGRQVGDPVHLPYRKGQFMTKDDNWVRADKDTATCRIEGGFTNEGDYELHCLQLKTPLWQVRLYQRAEGEPRMRFLGSVSVQTEAPRTEE